MKQYLSKFPESPLYSPIENTGERFFNPPLPRLQPIRPIDNRTANFQWHTSPRSEGDALVIILQEANKLLVEDFLNYLSTRCHPAPSASSLQDILGAVYCLRKNDGETLPLPTEEWQTPQTAQPASNKVAQGKPPSLHKWRQKDIDQIIDANLDNEDFRVANIAKAFNCCEMQVHRIIKEITDFSPAHYIRRYRLLKSQSFLADGKNNISQVAYMVGFKTPEHYSRCFKAEFGECPSDFRNKIGISEV